MADNIRVTTDELTAAASEIDGKAREMISILDEARALISGLANGTWISDASKVTLDQYRAQDTKLKQLPEWAEKAVGVLKQAAATYEQTEAAQESRAGGLGG